MITHIASSDDAKKRLDVVVAGCVPELSRTSVRKIIDEQRVDVNGTPQKQNYKVKESDEISIDFDPAELTEVSDIDLPVLYEDDDCIVINKPVGVLTHSKGAFNPEGTVATFIAPKVQGQEGDRAGIVHRLDRATSGVIICAKTPEALGALQKQFSQRKVKKTYYAIIKGELEPPKAIIDVPLARNPHDPKTFAPDPAGKHATTQYEVVESNNGYSLVKLTPLTGRTHQLRVHLNYVKRPIVGDPVYDGEPHNRMLLHAETLEITLSNRVRKVFTAPLPAEFHAILEA